MSNNYSNLYDPTHKGHTDKDCDERLEIVGACEFKNCPCPCHSIDFQGDVPQKVIVAGKYVNRSVTDS